ncbi:MAG: biopolymer transporter ExbD [Pedosphaera sp.]|nr:biopolymer transporter ExbD [Pedosphaera sp.]MSU42416.1 biopolymer transporter ExbD [Pedosphaera sp.]
MKLRRQTKLLIEPPAVATGDIAFNLIVFFLVCASMEPDQGRPMTIPRAEKESRQQQTKHIEVDLTRTAVFMNGNPLTVPQFEKQIRTSLSDKTREEDRIVGVKCKPDVAYAHWMNVSAAIEQAGGIVTLVREERINVQ